MADGAVDPEPSAQDWMLDQIAEEQPALVVRAKRDSGGDHGGDHSSHPSDDHDGPETVDEQPVLSDSALSPHRGHLDPSADDQAVAAAGPDIDAAAKRTGVWLGCAVLMAAVAIVLAFAVLGTRPDPVAPPVHRASSAAVTAAPTTANPAVVQQDQAVPFIAQTDSCTPAGGSSEQSAPRSPQALTDTGTDSAWVCGRGPQESLLDGQILHVRFTCDATRVASACGYMLHAVSVTPGWVAKTAAGKDDWLEHRVVRRLQFNFFNGDQLAADPFFLDTHNVHGPVSAALPSKILASRVDVIILHTERPPAAPPATTPAGHVPEAATPPPAAGVDPAPGPEANDAATPVPAEPAAGSDPVDATFAMGQLQFLGHAPD
jgi:hypothetical protein